MNLNRRVVLIDVGIAAALAVFVLIVAPGVAVAGMIGAFVLVVFGITFARDARRRRRAAVRPRRARH
jgi:hypothetical membrane protein